MCVKTLHLNVRREWYEQALSGAKTEEYRLLTPHWRTRLEGRSYERIAYHLGYPKRGDTSRTIVRPWRGYTIREITHQEFGARPVRVYAIKLCARVPHGGSSRGQD